MKTNTDLRGLIRPALAASLKSLSAGAELMAKSAAEQKQLLAKMRLHAARLSGYASLLKARDARVEEPRATARRATRPYSRTGIFQ